MRISDKIQRLQSVDLHAIINDAAKEKKDQIIRLNQDQMWKAGVMDVNKPGQKLEYAPSTIKQKKRKATFKKTSFITLRWFGDFYESMKLIFFKDRFEIAADDLKWANWLEPQGRFENALGLTDKSMTKLRKIITAPIIRRLKQAI
ncbi:hypothetical protein LCGC14_1043720 [marine sediment metagenome]|uniref:Uncharacterized protein n=1 Tax=marine sediment metagenome TaxID=412755 RepID=A0A0F9MQV8_9ZZZZ